MVKILIMEDSIEVLEILLAKLDPQNYTLYSIGDVRLEGEVTNVSKLMELIPGRCLGANTLPLNGKTLHVEGFGCDHYPVMEMIPMDNSPLLTPPPAYLNLPNRKRQKNRHLKQAGKYVKHFKRK